MKRMFVSCFWILFLGFLPVEAVTTSAQSAILMEAESGRVLYSHNQEEESLIASITKLMTALIAVESGIPLQDKVEITQESCGVEGSSLYLKEGDLVTLESLLYGMLLHSGNDAATAIALHCGGSMEDFVEKMNAKAQELGMENSHFRNPHGLNAEEHYSTAYDMALVAQACLAEPVVAEMVATRSISIDGRNFTNKNKLLWYYEGCVGMKTGYTQQAGRTLVSAATRDGMTLICVTLDAPNDWEDHQNLFDYGFEHYYLTDLTPEVPELARIPLTHSLVPFGFVGVADEFWYPLQGTEQVEFQVDVWESAVSTPLGQGDWVSGQAVWVLDGVEIRKQPLISLRNYPNTSQEKLSVLEKINKWMFQ